MIGRSIEPCLSKSGGWSGAASRHVCFERLIFYATSIGSVRMAALPPPAETLGLARAMTEMGRYR